MKTLNVLLGAGFSVPAGLPSGKDLSTRFDDDFTGKLLKWSSSEWQWADGKTEEQVYAGSLYFDHVTYAYLFNEIVADYKSNFSGLKNYEAFYDFVENYPSALFNKVRERAVARYIGSVEKPSQTIVSHLRTISHLDVLDTINHLIADALTLKENNEVILREYLRFVNLLRSYDRVNIHTLNHDLLVERILRLNGIDFSDGFSTKNTELMSFDPDEKILTFKNEFEQSKVALMKLHGSIDLNKYRIGEETGTHVQITGDYLYFKPGGYYEKHHVVRIDPTTENIVQQFPTDVVPSFITGVGKSKKIWSDYMYKELFNRFALNIKLGSDLIIIGYSFNDNHVNEIVTQAPIDTHIINVNPSTCFPFNGYREINIKYMSEL